MTSGCMCRWASYFNVLAIYLLCVLVTTKAHATLKPHKEFPSTELLRRPLTQGPMLGGVTCGLLSVPSADASTSVTRLPLTVSPEESRGYNPKRAPGCSYLTSSRLLHQHRLRLPHLPRGMSSLSPATEKPGQPTGPGLGKGQDWRCMSRYGSVVRSLGFCNHTDLVSNLSPAVSEPCTTVGKLLDLSGPQTPYPPNRDNGTNFPGFL